jgi:hypothetical protein
MRRLVSLAIACLCGLSACEGPNESAGREQDRAIAANSSTPMDGTGPNQRLGEAQDRADRADAKARDAKADALESEADRLRTQGDIAADRLDAQAKTARTGKAD